jgi:hypothetical protein
VKDAKRVDGKGTLCMFEEETVDSLESVDSATYHTLRSAHNRRWFLGLGQRTTDAPSRRPPPYAPARRLVRPAADFCGAHFSSGRHGPPPPSKAFYGVFDLVSDYIDGNSVISHRVNLKNSLAAKSDSSSSSRSHSKSSGDATSASRVESADDDGESSLGGDGDNAERKISAAHLEALQMQHQLTAQGRHRIRHAKHKRPRPSRQQKNLAKQLAKASSAESHL